MTRSIDEHVVDMQFNNKQFENGIDASLRSIDKLKKGLNFGKEVDNLSSLERAAGKFSLAGMSDTLDRIANKFSAFSVIAITALANITNSAINAGVSFAKALTIDPITTGLDEYETKMNAITTILTNTASKGTTLDDVNKSLSELNEYADQTIYNFAEMARNIGTFTAAGVGLEISTKSIKGIANLAAGSGSSALQASTAMYQLSQAIAAGSVKLIDWNSVVNAGMGGELFQNALKKTAKEMGIFVDETKPFRETLEQGWITADVLTTTLSKFADDPALIKAATQVKTFTQLISTMKESVQSGWAQTWENIIGDKEEAAKFFTAINDGFGKIAGGAADARNKMFAFWNANGGREATIKALSNVFNGLMSVLKPIGQAFREIFPATTGQQLVDLSKKIQGITSHFKIGETTAENLKNTFKGLFALLDIGKQILGGLITVFASVIKFLFPVSAGVLNVTGSIGEFIVSLDKALKSSNAFGNFFKTLGGIIVPIANGIRLAIVTLLNAIASLGNVDTNGIDKFAEGVTNRLKPLEGLGDFVQSLAGFFYGLADAIGAVFDMLRKFILKAIDTADFNAFFDAVNSGLFAAILYSIKKFIDSLSKLSNKTSGILGGITGTLDGVCGSLQALQSNLKSGTLLKIAISLGILAAALFTIAQIDSKKLTSSLGAITGLFLELFGSMAAFETIMGVKGFAGMFVITTGMIALSTAVLILASAMKKMGGLEWNEVAKGLISVVGMMGSLILASKFMGAVSPMMIKSGLGLIVFAAAINVLAIAVEKLGKLNGGNLTKGLIGIGVLLTELTIFMAATNLNKLGLIKAAGILVFAAALNVLGSAVSKISTLDPDALTSGLIGMAVILGEIVIFTNKMSGVKSLMVTAIGLTVIANALNLLAQGIVKMAVLSWDQVGRGLTVMAGALTAITLAFNLLPKNILWQSIAIMDVAGAMTFLAKALTSMATLTWDQIARGLTAMASSLALVLGAFMMMSKGQLVDSTAFLILATSITILAVALKTMGGLSLPQLGMGLLTLASAFALFGIAGLTLSPLIPVLLGLSGTLILFGVSVLAVGAGVLLLGTGLAALAAAGTAAAVTLTAVVTSIAGLIPFLFKQAAQGVVEFVKGLANSATAVAQSVAKIVIELVKAFGGLIPSLTNLVGKLLVSLLNTLNKYIPKIVDSGMKLVVNFLKGVSEHIKDVITAGINLVVQVIEGVSEGLPKLIQSAFNLVVSFLNGLADALETNAPIIMLAIARVFLAIPKAIVKILTGGISDLVGVGKNLVQGLINGIKSMLTNVANVAGDLGTGLINAVKKVLGINSPSKVFQDEVGKMIGLGTAQGIDKSVPKVTSSSKKMSEAAVKAAKEAFDKSVKWIEDRKYYNQLSLQEELAAWERLQQRYTEGSEERIKADKEVYRVKQELYKSNFDNSVNWIEEEKYYNRMGLIDELAAWERVQKRYIAGTEERKKADREVYRLEQEINDATMEYLKQSAELQEAAAKKRQELEDDYYEKTKEINEKLIEDIQSVTDEYNNAVESRTKELASAYSLFDEVDTPEAVTGDQLLTNLRGQVSAFDSWQTELNHLRLKGIDEGLIDEIEAMGPKMTAQIKALNSLSSGQLGEYVTLWRRKYSEAKDEAVIELEDTKTATQTKISELNAKADAELSEYRATWLEQTQAVNDDTDKQLETLKSDFSKKMYAIKSGSETTFEDMSKNLQGTTLTMNNNIVGVLGGLITSVQAMTRLPEWSSLGVSIVDGIIQGINNRSSALYYATANMAREALASAKRAINAHSPSKEFEKLGNYAVDGFVIGLENLSSVVTSSKDLGKTALNSLSNAVSNVMDVINSDIDSSPTIRPVIDLTNVMAGKKTLDGMFSDGLNVTDVNMRVSSMSGNIKSGNSSLDSLSNAIYEMMTQNKKDQNGTLSFDGLFNGATFTVRNDNDIRKITTEVIKEIYNTTFNTARGKGLARI